MKQATTVESPLKLEQINKRIREGLFILLCSLALYLLIALVTYHPQDPAWSHTGMGQAFHNAAGKTGALLSDVLLSAFGYLAYILPFIFIFFGVCFYKERLVSKDTSSMIWILRGVGLLLALITSCGLIAIHFAHSPSSLPMSAGGLMGIGIKTLLVSNLNFTGATLMLFSLLLVGITLFTGLSWFKMFDYVARRLFHFGKDKALPLGQKMFFKNGKIKLFQEDLPDFPKLLPPKKAKLKQTEAPVKAKAVFNDPLEDDLEEEPLPLKKTKLKETIGLFVKKKKAKEEALLPETALPSMPHSTPSLGLLEAKKAMSKPGYSTAALQELSRLVEMRLLEFGVEVKVVGVYPGPVITRFELNLAAGIKVNRITTLAKDLARSLSVVSVRVVEVIPGKPVVGLEIPNVNRELVTLKEVLEDGSYQRTLSPLALVLGKDIAGKPVVVDLAKMPHLLVAGTTGSGKSVGLNAMLLSILFKASPEEVRMILIDPKMLELAVYDNIPHLLTPVVTDMKDAANALRWCVAEMERRYQLMASLGVRNLTGYNQKVQTAEKAGRPILDPFSDPLADEPPQPLEVLPYIVVVVDEFADMMMVVGKKVEELIARIAQKARAAGIHLILATQRPSVDVITGLIKANIPTRIAFQVSSKIDSRTIIDQSGAEQLLGHGDMLYLPPGQGIPQRIHGAFVSDDEVHKVANDLRKLGNPTYIENVVESSFNLQNLASEEETDELYDQAVFVVTQARKASISLVQRRLKIGYNRAARLVEQMESQGVVSEVQSNGGREVLAPPPVE